MTDNHTSHSAEVKMHVVHDGSELQVSQLGPDFLVPDEADDFEGPAQVILSVDGERIPAMSSCSVDQRAPKRQSRSCKWLACSSRFVG